MSARKGESRTILTEDGELRESAEDAAALEPEFCTRCGTPNPPQSLYCRKCGHSLEEQAADVLGMANYRQPGSKGKHDRLAQEDDEAPARARADDKITSRTHTAVAQIMTMLGVAGMAITALVTSNRFPEHGVALLPIAIAWISIEGVRSGHRPMHVSEALVSIFTMLIVVALTVVALVTGNGVAVIPLMIGWLSIEAIRHG